MNNVTKNFADQELKNCSFVKTVLMLVIVLYHSILFWGGNWFTGAPVYDSKVLLYLARWMNSFHIYAFALVSGYLFYFLKHEKQKYDKFLPFVANKSKRLLIPYVFIAAIWVIPIQWIFFRNSFFEIFKKYILGTSPSQLWFLLMLFGVFVIFWPLSNFFKNHNIIGIAVVAFLYCISIVGPIIVPNVLQIWTACAYVPFFWLGFKMRQYISTGIFGFIRKLPCLVWFLVHICLFVLGEFLSVYSSSIIFKMANIGLQFFLHIVGAIMAFQCFQKLTMLIKPENKLLQSLSNLSMPIYLVHQQVIYFFIYFLNGVVNPYINALINFVGALIVSIFISVLLLKFKATRFLVGEK